MKIFEGQLSSLYTGLFTQPDFDKTVNGNYIKTYTSPSIVQEGGVTKIRTKPFDMSKYYTLGVNRNFTLYSHINGSTMVDGGGGASISIGYQVASKSSGATWTTVAGKLRIGGTSISGTSGTAVASITSPVMMPFWRLEFTALKTSHSTADMTVDYALVVE